ncbi:hypothetical protein [Cohnella algarum]|uniref:hypothetical protein n=1 Tax=Cohnella algarum TaxID=2044859 RepID=UPI00196868B9|nr:hypothetical protein [Cohnella algarum]MBN2981355.1 hypothetical protein [Cohnella algarum]
MLRTLNTLLAIRTSSAANRFFYYVKRLPLVGGRVSDGVYSRLKLKKAASVVMLVLSLLWPFLTKIAYMGLLVYLPVALWGQTLPQEERLLLFYHIFAMLSFVVVSFSSATVLEPKREKYIAVKLMRMPAGRYMRTSLTYRYVLFFVSYVPALFLFASLLGATLWPCILLAVSVALWRVFVEFLHLKLFDKTGHVLIKNNAVVWLAIALGYAAAYLPILFRFAPPTGSLLVNVPATLAIAAAGLYATVRLARYRDYAGAVEAAAKRDDPLLNIGQMMADAQKNEVKTKESDFSPKALSSDKFNGKEGYAYLNALFFARHRSLVNKPLYVRLAIVGALAAIGVIFGIAYREHAAALDLGALVPYTAISMFALSVGERVCRAMFYNCDLSLLRYGFYRNAVPRHFRIRLARMLGLNLLTAAALGSALTLFALAAGVPMDRDLPLLWILILSFSVFYSVHHLFMYYIFQPYTTELNSKNPFYHVINSLVSSASGFSIIYRGPAQAFAIAILVLSLAYLTAALILVRKYGHRTFRVK